MNTAAKIKGIIVFKDSSDGIIKFRFFFDETTYESPVVTKNTLSDAELFILQTQLSDSLYFNTVRKQLKTAYKYLLMGKKMVKLYTLVETFMPQHKIRKRTIL